MPKIKLYSVVPNQIPSSAAVEDYKSPPNRQRGNAALAGSGAHPWLATGFRGSLRAIGGRRIGAERLAWSGPAFAAGHPKDTEELCRV